MPTIDFKALSTLTLAFVLAQAWGEGAGASVRALYPSDRRSGAHAALIYALAVTLVVVIIVACANHASRVLGFTADPSTRTSKLSQTPGTTKTGGAAAPVGPVVRW